MSVAILSVRTGYVAALGSAASGVRWSSNKVLTKDELVQKLLELGADSASIGTAFDVAGRLGDPRPINMVPIGDRYLAVAESSRLGVWWFSQEPERREGLARKLVELGFHPTDVYDAESRAEQMAGSADEAE